MFNNSILGCGGEDVNVTSNTAQLGLQHSISMQIADCNDTMIIVRNLPEDIVKAVKADLHAAMTSFKN
jgi:hypothetical protein